MAVKDGFAPGGPQASDFGGLGQLSEIHVKQQIDFLEMFTNIEVSNNYNIYRTKNDLETGARWWMAMEHSGCCQRQCCKSRRKFTMDIGPVVAASNPTTEQRLGVRERSGVDPVIKIERPFTCCLTEMDVADSQSVKFAHIDEECKNLWGCVPTVFNITDMEGNIKYHLKGPSKWWIQCCMSCPCRDPYEWEVNEGDTRAKVGSVKNVPNGWCRMCLTDADDYEINFPHHATPAMKAALLAQVFALDYSYFEIKKKNDN
eukprot:TRINITY_DN56614_c0_g2_i1.p1 TRINITY_DN56614_c0_g2~~TRINITY_DN56614_c0_g2_i1.p1  ORF type:complete len:288 (+),score=39.57 TRINITY_DN56614_c0_g2_i1:90-866(+)